LTAAGSHLRLFSFEVDDEHLIVVLMIFMMMGSLAGWRVCVRRRVCPSLGDEPIEKRRHPGLQFRRCVSASRLESLVKRCGHRLVSGCEDSVDIVHVGSLTPDRSLTKGTGAAILGLRGNYPLACTKIALDSLALTFSARLA
jgi:hypothetical protein